VGPRGSVATLFLRVRGLANLARVARAMTTRDRDTRKRIEAFSEGVLAFQRGADEGNNPHPNGSDLHKRWLSGWKSAEATSIEQAPRTDGGKTEREK